MRRAGRPTIDPMITVALVDDYDVVLLGLARMLDGYRDRVRVVQIDANEDVDDVVDIVLYDSFAQPESDQDEIAVLVGNPGAHRVVVYTWNFHPDLVDNLVRVDLHDAHPVAVTVEHAGHPEQHDVVVVHQRHRDHRVNRRASRPPHTTSLGV